MKLEDCRIRLRPRAVSEVMDLAGRFVLGEALLLNAKVAAVFLLPGYVLVLLCRYLLEWESVAVWVLAAAYVSFMQGPFTVAVGKGLFDKQLSLRQIIAGFFGRFWSYTFAWITRIVAVLSSWIFFPIMPYVASSLLFFGEASLLEMAGARQALRRSSQFVAPHRGRVMMFWFNSVLTTVCFVAGAELLMRGIVIDLLQLGDIVEPFLRDYFSPYSLLGLFATCPFLATSRFFLYVDHRTRQDGWDIQVRFSVLAAHEKTEALA